MDHKRLYKPSYSTPYSKRHIRRLINTSKNRTSEKLHSINSSHESNNTSDNISISNNTTSLTDIEPLEADCSSTNNFTNNAFDDTNPFNSQNNTFSNTNNYTIPCPSLPQATPNTFNANKSTEFLKSLTSWAVKTCLSHNAFNELLNVLSAHLDFVGIPKDCRTLLKFDKSLKKDINLIVPGQYYHFGLKEGILEALKQEKYGLVDKNILKVSVNIDGLPLTKSSSSQFWPILACLDNFKNSDPFPIGIYHGKTKPENSNDFLNIFVEEFQALKVSGINLNSSNFQVKISKILCDAPAKAYVLNVKGHNSYSGCTKCKVVGEYTSHRMAYLNTNAALRTHEEFISMLDKDYHKGETILNKLDIDLINNVPLDYMHLVCLGVTKRLLSFWLSGHQGVRLFKEDIETLNNNLEQVRASCVKEFSRLPRSLKELDRWKATELRQFLLYYGPIVLKNILKEPLWSHFLSLHVAIRILICPDLSSKDNFLIYAEKLLHYFVNKFGEIYGDGHVGHNVHNLIHLVEDVRHHGPLDTFSCFQFENYMYKIKKTLKTSNHPLKQYINRHYEFISHYSSKQKDCSKHLLISIGFKLLDSEIVTLFKEFSSPNFHFSVAEPNCFAFLKSGLAIQFLNFYEKGNTTLFECKLFNPLRSFYTIPLDSRKISCGKIAGFLDGVNTFTIDDISCKAIKIEDCLLPLLHSF